MQARLTRRIGSVLRGEHLAANRRDVDDASAFTLFDHLAREGATHEEAAVQIDINDAPPNVGFHVDDRSTVFAAGRTRIVDDKVDASVFFNHLVNECVNGPVVRYIAHNGSGFATQGPNFVRHRFDIAPPGRLLVVGIPIRRSTRARHHDIAARPGEFDGDRSPDAPHSSCPRNHCHLSVQASQFQAAHVRSFLLFGWAAALRS